jgi:glycosyltransferase involved in cell wall biosynthesis
MKVPGVEIVGRVKNLAPWYEQTRLFVAPTRFAAGIPLKIVEASAYGLPTIMTPLLLSQLQWTAERDCGVGETPEQFAAAVLKLYNSEQLWNTIQANVLQKMESQYSPAALKQSLELLLERAEARRRNSPSELGKLARP